MQQVQDPLAVLYVGAGKHVAAIDVTTGQELWRTKLPEGAGAVCVMFSQGCLFASGMGHVYRLAPEDGRILWHNGLKGMGMGLVTMAVEGLDTQQGATVHTLQQQAAQAANAAH
jgi:hypothetical protein